MVTDLNAERDLMFSEPNLLASNGRSHQYLMALSKVMRCLPSQPMRLNALRGSARCGHLSSGNLPGQLYTGHDALVLQLDYAQDPKLYLEYDKYVLRQVRLTLINYLLPDNVGSGHATSGLDEPAACLLAEFMGNGYDGIEGPCSLDMLASGIKLQSALHFGFDEVNRIQMIAKIARYQSVLTQMMSCRLMATMPEYPQRF